MRVGGRTCRVLIRIQYQADSSKGRVEYSENDSRKDKAIGGGKSTAAFHFLFFFFRTRAGSRGVNNRHAVTADNIDYLKQLVSQNRSINDAFHVRSKLSLHLERRLQGPGERTVVFPEPEATPRRLQFIDYKRLD